MRTATTGVVAGCVVALIGCGTRKPAARPTVAACAQPTTQSKDNTTTTCATGKVELKIVNDSQLAVTKTRLRVDDAQVGPGVIRTSAGEHQLAVELELRGVVWAAGNSTHKRVGKPKRATGRLRFASAEGCRLIVRVRALDPRRAHGSPRIQFDQHLHCKNGFRAKASIPEPQPLPALPAMKVPALRRWGAVCMRRAAAAQRYLDLAVAAMSTEPEHVVTSCVHRKRRRVHQLRALIESSVKFVKRPSRSELHQDARMAQLACLSVLDLQAEAAHCR